MSRLIIISNRLPVTGTPNGDTVNFAPSAGGLATGLQACLQRETSRFQECIWLGWPGFDAGDSRKEAVREALQQYNCIPVFYTQALYESFYLGFCNSTVWPLFHSMPTLATYTEEQWQHYQSVNTLFFEEIAGIVQEDDVLWIHDFHLMLLPERIRKRFPRAVVGFFLHIPFPPFELFRLLKGTWQNAIVKGLLACDLIGFHTHDYAQYFMNSVLKITGRESDGNTLYVENRMVRIDSYPMGIDYNAFHQAASHPDVIEKRDILIDGLRGQKMILSIDRLDYTKGILQRLLAYEQFLKDHAAWRGQVCLMLILVPSRADVQSYKKMKEQIDELVGKINGVFSTDSWQPVIYQFKTKTFKELVALYGAADMALVTPLRDGMNLIAKEFIASRTNGKGVLVLSEMTGASQELLDAVMINPNHVTEIVDAISSGLSMPEHEQWLRLSAMQETIRSYDVFRWNEHFLNDLQRVRQGTSSIEAKRVDTVSQTHWIKTFFHARRRLMILDYDGTLVPFEKYPALAAPPQTLLETLSGLLAIGDTTIVIMSGRDRNTLETWFSGVNVSFIAEHGAWIRDNASWRATDMAPVHWKEILKDILCDYVSRLPGSFIEEKESSLVWHFRNSDIGLSRARKTSLMEDLEDTLSQYALEITSEVKSIEIRKRGISKASALSGMLTLGDYDSITCMGDDHSDEQVFQILSGSACTFKVGAGLTRASFILPAPESVMALLNELKNSVTRLYRRNSETRAFAE